MLRNVSLWQLAIIVLAIVILVGWKRLPDMARSVGRSMRVFKSEVDQMHGPRDDEHRDDDADLDDDRAGTSGRRQHGAANDRPRPLEGEVQQPEADPRTPGQERADAAARRDDDRPAG